MRSPLPIPLAVKTHKPSFTPDILTVDLRCNRLIERANLMRSIGRIGTAILILWATVASVQSQAAVLDLKSVGGTFAVPVQINGKITLDFVIDSGATDVTIPADVFSTLERAGAIEKADFRGSKTYVLANGATERAQIFRIRSLSIGNIVVKNVKGSVSSANGPLLLGQSFLARFQSWSIDNGRHQLLLNESPASIGSKAPEPYKPDHSVVAAPQTSNNQPKSPDAEDAVFMRAIRYLLTGDDSGEIEFLDLSSCEFKVQHFDAKYFSKTEIHLNNVEEARTVIQKNQPSYGASGSDPNITIKIRGQNLARWPRQKALTTNESDRFVSEYTWTINTTELDRVNRAWRYIYSHGCKFSKDPNF
jgi:clan AA aspartic protease (TIGR02281 family)